MSVIDSEAFCKASLEPLMADSAIGFNASPLAAFYFYNQAI
jgi:hypothetical protein